MFSSALGSSKADGHNADTSGGSSAATATTVKQADEHASSSSSSPFSAEKRTSQGPASSNGTEKKRGSGLGSKASSLIAAAKKPLQNVRSSLAEAPSSLLHLGKQDPALTVPQGSHNNSAGESTPGPRSTFHVGVWEDRNRKCRRTMEDTHAFLYNFLATPAPTTGSKSHGNAQAAAPQSKDDPPTPDVIETDNGYFAVFDGHAGAFAADWCGKKLHIIVENKILENPNQPIPELLDESFTTADVELEKLPTKNSGCTAAIAVLRWEDRVPSTQSVTASEPLAPAIASAVSKTDETPDGHGDAQSKDSAANEKAQAAASKLKSEATRKRVLYTANVGDARIVLCRNGEALRLSYDHKGSDENEGKRIADAGGRIINQRVNGVLAVTRALGDTYMKYLVTGRPYTTETVIEPDSDEFIIIACDGLWDVCSDQQAVDLVRDVQDPIKASKLLVDFALKSFSTDNLSCMIVRFDRKALKEAQRTESIGVEGDVPGRQSEVTKIVNSASRWHEQHCAIVSDDNNESAIADESVNVSRSSSVSSAEECPTLPDSNDGDKSPYISDTVRQMADELRLPSSAVASLNRSKELNVRQHASESSETTQNNHNNSDVAGKPAVNLNK